MLTKRRITDGRDRKMTRIFNWNLNLNTMLNPKHRLFALLFSLIGCWGSLSAQHLEFGMLGGASNYLGDLSNNSNSIYIKETNLAGGAFVRYNFLNVATLRLGVNYTTLSGHDEHAPDAELRGRNLSFYTPLLDVTLTGEFNILGYQPYNLFRPFSPYLFAGIGMFTYDPGTFYEGEKVKLRPLGTEGQGRVEGAKTYGKSGISIPFGLGFKYALSDKLNLGLEFGARLTNTDYLDDVSTVFVDPQLLDPLAAALSNRSGEIPGNDLSRYSPGMPRGDTKAKDWFFIAGLTISYNFIDNGLVGSRARRSGGRKGCRTE